MKNSSKTALGGIIAALSISIMFMVSVVPFLTYALPAAAAVLLVPIVIEINKKWALGVYFSVSVLSLIILPNKEVAVIYAAFFGYYQVIKAFLENHLKKCIDLVIKLLIFNFTISVSYYLMLKFMGIKIDEFETLCKYAVPVLLGLGSFAFILYDFALTRIIGLYISKWHCRFKKIFR